VTAGNSIQHAAGNEYGPIFKAAGACSMQIPHKSHQSDVDIRQGDKTERIRWL
jgi:hypothetical protein